MYAEHEHGTTLNGDWQHDRIECGCGCHNSIDSLPQLLSPLMTSHSAEMTDQLAVSLPVQYEMAWLVSAVRVLLPPPQYR